MPLFLVIIPLASAVIGLATAGVAANQAAKNRESEEAIAALTAATAARNNALAQAQLDAQAEQTNATIRTVATGTLVTVGGALLARRFGWV